MKSQDRSSILVSEDKSEESLSLLHEMIQSLVPMYRLQRAYVVYALTRFGGNKVHTAAALGIERRTIQRWNLSGEFRVTDSGLLVSK